MFNYSPCRVIYSQFRAPFAGIAVVGLVEAWRIMSEQFSKREALRFEIRARVQGVGYRYHVRAAAVAAGITGWIRILPNGIVQVHAEGSPEQLQGFRGSLKEGSSYGNQPEVEERPVESEQCTRFEIRH